MHPSTYDASATASGLAADFSSEIRGKVVLTTGVSPGGLGAVFAQSIAKSQPQLLILAGRNTTKVQETAQAIQSADANVEARVLALDLGSLAGARKAAETVLSWDDVPAIDVLVNNAGIMAVGEYKKTVDGYESQFATNHLAHFLFTNLIMKKLLAAAAPRVVNDGESYNKWVAYGQSKTANMLFSLSLAEKLGKRGLQSNSLHPGLISTNLGNHISWENDDGLASLKAIDQMLGNKEGWADFKWKTPEQGAATHVYAAFAPDLKDHNGAYLENSHVADPQVETVMPWATSPYEAERLWKLSEKLVGQEFAH